MGFPGFLGPITGIAEVIASVLILLGLYSKLSNLLLAFIMAGAIAGVHIPASVEQATVTAGLERDLMILVGVLVLAAFGPGILALSSRRSALES
ncbi:MAG: DoxX family protein [Cyanobacteria bacterium P01_D01_bin.44]